MPTRRRRDARMHRARRSSGATSETSGPPGDPETVPRLLDYGRPEEGLDFETLHVRRDGSVFPI